MDTIKNPLLLKGISPLIPHKKGGIGGVKK